MTTRRDTISARAVAKYLKLVADDMDALVKAFEDVGDMQIGPLPEPGSSPSRPPWVGEPCRDLPLGMRGAKSAPPAMANAVDVRAFERSIGAIANDLNALHKAFKELP